MPPRSNTTRNRRRSTLAKGLKHSKAIGPEWYQRAYFERLVEEELSRCGPGPSNLALLVLRFPEVSRLTASLLSSFVSNQLRSIDMFGLLGDGDYAICLPDADASTAGLVADAARDFFADCSASVGGAIVGQDGTEFSELLTVAQRRLT